MKYSHFHHLCLTLKSFICQTLRKSDLLSKCIQPLTQPEPPTDCPIIDGAAVVHFLPVSEVVTFNDYAENVFLPYLQM